MTRTAVSDNPLCDVTLAVIAGGEGRRMGRPKTALKFNGQPILAYLLDRLAWGGPTLLVTTPSREYPAGHDLFDAEVIDLVAGQGPVRGILTALLNANTPVVVVVPVDMPGLEHECVSWVAERLLERPTITGVMTQRGTELQPFPAAFRRTVTSVIHVRLEKGLHSVKGLADEDGVIVVAAPNSWPDTVWTNLNYSADLRRFTSGLTRAKSQEGHTS